MSVVQANGVPDPDGAAAAAAAADPATPASMASSTSVVPAKRKHEETDALVNGDGVTDAVHAEAKAPAASPATKRLIREFVTVLESHDTTPSLLKRPLADVDSAAEPDTKRQKSSDAPATASIVDKIAADNYNSLDDLAVDLLAAIDGQLAELRAAPVSSPETTVTDAAAAAMAKTMAFQETALQLFRREKAYPKVAGDPSMTAKPDEMTGASNRALSIWGLAPQGRTLYSSLQQSVPTLEHPEGELKSLSEVGLPGSVSLTTVIPIRQQVKPQTLGDLFAPSRPQAPLLPPKAPKSKANGNRLGWYVPELAEKSRYRTGSYFSHRLVPGHYLDYSNATPSSQTKPKQRERAQSLAGHKPSVVELETSESEALFRGVFSSFAPCKDDSSAIVPASLVGRMHWQKYGHKTFDKLCAEFRDYDIDDAPSPAEPEPIEIDEEFIEKTLETWDDSVVDPSLGDVISKPKPVDEMSPDELLDEVSDMIERLQSFQRIRYSALPSSQNRHSADPVNADMLTNGAVARPDEEEMMTYEMLKNQLKIIIATLPPHAVAKLRGDQLDELLVSTKIEVRTDEYKGVMEHDEAAVQARIRQQTQATPAAPPVRPPIHRAPGSAPMPFQPQHYGTPNRTPIPPPNYYRGPQTPMAQPNAMPRPGVPYAPTPQPPRPAPTQPYRPSPNGFPQFAPHLAKQQTPYGHQNMPQYAGRPPPHPSFGAMQPQQPQQVGPNRYPTGYGPGYSPQAGVPTPQQYAAYTNGATPQMPPRTMSPQVPGQPYSPSPSPHLAQAGPRPQPPPPYVPNPQRPQYPQQAGVGQVGNPGPSGFHTVLTEHQQQRMMDQARARLEAQQRSQGFSEKLANSGPPISGLAGIGLGGPGYENRIAAQRAASMAAQQKVQTPIRNGAPPSKITPVPLPAVPGMQQRKPPTSS